MTEVVSKQKKREVTDERGNAYLLKGKVGEGGQGMVCLTNHENTLVKICRRPKVDREQWMEHIRWLMRQDLDNLNIARPVARIVKPQPGYVMELMDGLISLQSLVEKTEVALQEQNTQAYLDQGGIRRRLQLLAKLARILANLHGRGMAFGDLSPSNIYVSADPQYSEVWLIDCDNISVNQRNSYDAAEDFIGKAGSVYTPFYGAPEVIRGEAMISSLTDSWSFSVIAFRLLTALHPLIGDMVSDGEPSLEDDALSGKLPWIDHPDDRSNEATSGLPRDLVLLKPLKELFEKSFNAGKDEPGQRPSLSEWAEKFEHACQWLVDCDTCGSSYYYHKPVEGKLSCSFCDSAAKSGSLLFLRHYLYDQSILEVEGAQSSDCWVDTGFRQVLRNASSVDVKTSPPGSSFYDHARSLYQIALSDEGVIITPTGTAKLKISVGKSKAQTFSKPFQLKNEEQARKTVSLMVSEASPPYDVCIFKW